MTLSVLMPVYNERDTIGEIVERVLGQPLVGQLVIVDDGSTDGTERRLRHIRHKDPRIEILTHEVNRGKGAAIRTALARATEPVCIIQDADLEYNPADYPQVIRPILNHTHIAVFGSRVLHPENTYPIDWFRIGSYAVTLTANLLYGCQLTDQPTGYKAFDTAFLRSLSLGANGFSFCAEVTALTRKSGHEIVEIPIRYSKRSVAEGKKIRWTDGVAAMWTLARCRVTSASSS